MIVFPFVMDFYATQPLSPASRLVAMQLLVRGPILVGLLALAAAAALATGFRRGGRWSCTGSFEWRGSAFI
jgi:hypothetical protein